MTPWHRFWFPDDPATPQRAPRDAALWSPTALSELQQSIWQQTAEATAQWWRFVSAAWPGVPVQPLSGSVTAPAPEPASRPARTASRPPGVRTPPRAARKATAAPKRPRSTARGK